MRKEYPLNQKILPVEYPVITTYTHHAHLLSILGTKKEAFPWIISNYIQVFINKNFKESSWGDFYFPMPYETRTVENCKWLFNQKIRENLIDDRWNSIVDFVIDALDNNNYVNMMINYKYLSKSSLYKKTDWRHDVMVYGYDNEEKKLFCADFLFKSAQYEFSECSFEEFEDAYKNRYSYTNSTYLDHCVHTFEINSACDYEYDERNILALLKQYYSSEMPEYWKNYNQKNSNKLVFGMQFYDALSIYLREKDNPNIDIRPFYLMQDHKNIMIERIKYLATANVALSSYIAPYEQVFINCKKLVKIIMKYNYSHSPSTLEDACLKIENIKQNEKELLEAFLRDFSLSL